MSDARICGKCGAALGEGTRFCRRCGAPIGSADSVPKHTIAAFGDAVPPTPGALSRERPQGPARDDADRRDADRRQAADAEHERAQADADAADATSEHGARKTDVGLAHPAVGAPGRTVMGIPGSDHPASAHAGAPGDEADTSQSAPSGAAPSARPAPGPALGAAGRTVMGLPQAPASDAAAARGRTVLGVAAPPADANQPPAAEASDAAKKKLNPAASGSTMLGIAPRDAATVQALVGAAKRGATAPAASGATLLDGDGPKEPERAPAQPAAPAESWERESSQRMTTDPVLPVRRGPSLAIVVLLLLLAAGAVALIVLSPGASRAATEVEVVRDGAAEYMQFHVPDAPPGTRLRFGGQEHVLEDGVTRFALSPESLQVGRNAVPVEVVQPSGETRAERIVLELQHRITLDTAPLERGELAVNVLVSAVPGSRVVLDGQELPLDAEGHGSRRDALERPEPGASEIPHNVHYRVQPPEGDAVEGDLSTRIPVAPIRIERPGDGFVTDRSSVEIAGVVPRGATLTIDGTEQPVRDGRFVYVKALPSAQAYDVAISVRAAGMAPNTRVVRIERVKNLAQAATGFPLDGPLDYARLAEDPEALEGRRAAFEGRVYAAAVQGGQSVLQLLLRDCPAGSHCPLWVTYPAATDIGVDRWVRVIGTVVGRQQFRAETDEVRSVPKVEAAFLLPLAK